MNHLTLPTTKKWSPPVFSERLAERLGSYEWRNGKRPFCCYSSDHVIYDCRKEAVWWYPFFYASYCDDHIDKQIGLKQTIYSKWTKWKYNTTLRELIDSNKLPRCFESTL